MRSLFIPLIKGLTQSLHPTHFQVFRMNPIHIIHITALLTICLLVSSCTAKQEEKPIDLTTTLASVHGEILDEGDLEKSQAWMPTFARQLESNQSIVITRFWSLIQFIRIAQDAQDKGMLTPAERSLAIKEALAAKNIADIQYPSYVIEENEIQTWIQANSDKLIEPASFTVNYSLIKNESKIPALIASLGMSNGAQMGYNYVDPDPLTKNEHAGGPITRNMKGHHIEPKIFNFIFTQTQRENEDEQAQLGPFTQNDGLRFSCPEAIAELEKATLNKPINHSINCSDTWKAFVIPIWRQEASRMTDEKARQTAISAITESKRAEYREKYISDILAKH